MENKSINERSKRLTETQKINKMLKMQETLNKSILAEHKAFPSLDQVRVALLDEIGELTHEIKHKWCWWKKTQAEENKEKILEELVDVWHFVLTIYILKNGTTFDRAVPFEKMKGDFFSCYISITKSLLEYSSLIITETLELTLLLEFDFDDVYEMYLKKNKVNYERLKNGY